MKNPAIRWSTLITILAAAAVSASAGERLGLGDYLTQVEGKNDGLRASRELSRGAELRAGEGGLLLSPRAFGRFVYSSDERETVSPDFQGRKTEAQVYSLGVRQTTSFGLDASLTYNLTSTTISGANPSFVSQPSFFTASPVLELSQSFWKNGFGSQTRARQELLEAQALATSHVEAYQAQALRAEAEVAYWNLALARATVRVQKESLGRFEKMRDLHRRKSGIGLSDRADLLQAEAAVGTRRLDFQNAEDSERTAARTFNTIRGIDADQVGEVLAPITPELIDGMKVLAKSGLREDVKAAQEQERIAEANSRIGSEDASPDLRVFASLSLNGRDQEAATSINESWSGTHPWNSIGVEFSAPLDLGTVSRARQGHAATRQGAELRYQRAVFDQERQWNDITKRFGDAKARLELARAVQASQKEKLEYERGRHNKGRSTTFQVLTFEQDYANSQLAYLQAQATILQTIAQMKTFGGSL